MAKNYLIILVLLICSYGGYSQWNGVQDELVSFEAKELNQKIKFTWVVRAEINTENYYIKRSIDEINFEEIVQIKSKGNSSNQRTYIGFDNDPIIGTIFYTLLSQDYNGDTLFSKTIAFDNDYETPRPVKRVIQKEILNQLSKEILAGSVSPEDDILIDAFDDTFVFRKNDTANTIKNKKEKELND